MQTIDYMMLMTLGLLVMGIGESVINRYNILRIPARIHVSGTRGKSSVSRLIAAGLKGAGVSVAAKTTGTLARMILPDGREVPVFRPAGANIMEQARIVRAAAEMKVKALVLECMALQPELHWISEKVFVKATHGVITNCRPDHLDIMGPETRDVALCLAGMIPVKGKLFTAEKDYLDILSKAASDRGTQLVAVSDDDVAAVTKEELSGFTYTEHAENIALALKVLGDFNIPRRQAMESMWELNPDPGALCESRLNFFGRDIMFVNAFAANDPQSTEKIWKMMLAKYPSAENVIAVLNLRDDRPNRTIQMALETDFWKNADKVVLMGSGSYLFSRMIARQSDYPLSKFIYTENDRVEDIFEKIIECCGASALVIGVGNIGGLGMPLARYFNNRKSISRSWSQ